MQAAPFQVASGAQLTSCTAWRQGVVVQAVQTRSGHLKAPAGACWIHWSTQSSPCWPPGSPTCLFQDLEMWLAAQADLDPEVERSKGYRQRPQD